MNGIFRVGEIVRTGNSTGTVRSYDTSTQFITIININGSFNTGDYITGDDSGANGILNGFSAEESYDDTQYDTTNFDELDNFIVTDRGEFIATDDHFDGTPSQEYQTEFIIIL